MLIKYKIDLILFNNHTTQECYLSNDLGNDIYFAVFTLFSSGISPEW